MFGHDGGDCGGYRYEPPESREYHLLYVDGWDHGAGEATGGGRCVGTYQSVEGALHAADAFRQAAPLMWGPGHLVITDAEGNFRWGPSVAPAREMRVSFRPVIEGRN